MQEHPGCKITILEIPLYSIVNWNQSLRHKDPSTFSDQDKQLQEHIDQLSGDIKQINKDLKVYSPSFLQIYNVIVRLRKRNTQKRETTITLFYIVTEYIQGTDCLSIGYVKSVIR